MLPQLYQDRYQTFLDTLTELKNAVTLASRDSAPPNPTAIGQAFTQVKQVYQKNILPLSEEKEDKIPVEERSSWQSIQTEINRTMRLLQTDVLFLQAARQQATRQEREQGCLQKIDKLIQFCHTLIAG